MAKDIKTRAYEIFIEHLPKAEINQTMFRRLVVDLIIEEFSTPEKPMSLAASGSHYNTAKKRAEAEGRVTGLGRPPKDPSEIKPERTSCTKAPFEDEDCITVLEVINNVVTRTGSYLDESFARQELAKRRASRFPTTWKIIKGLGPNVGDVFKLHEGEFDLEANSTKVIKEESVEEFA